MLIKSNIACNVLAVLSCTCFAFRIACASQPEQDTRTVELEMVFQNGAAYASVYCDTNEQKINLNVDVNDRSTVGRLLRFDDLDEWIRGENIEIIDARLELYYIDEFWSHLKYHVGVSRSLDGTVKNMESEPQGTVVIYGDKFPINEKTQRPSWISISIDPGLIRDWVKNASENHGLVLHVPKVNRGKDGELVDLNLIQSGSGSLFVGFRSCEGPGDGKTPKLVVRYRVTGNAPPTPILLGESYSLNSIYSKTRITWPASTDPNEGDTIHYEFEAGHTDAKKIIWTDASADLNHAEAIWHSAVDRDRFYKNSGLPEEEHKLWYRVRAVDNAGAFSRWSTRGPLRVTDKSWTVWGTDGSRKIWPGSTPVSEHGSEIKIKAARNEWEPFQVVVMAHTDIPELTIETTPLSDRNGNQIQPATIYREHYVSISSTANAEHGHLGLVPDGVVPLIHPSTGKPTGGQYGGNVFNVPLGSLEVFWLDVFVPAETHAGIFRGSVIVSAKGINDVVLPIELEVFGFTLPSPKQLMAAFQLGSDKVRHSHPAVRSSPNRKQVEVELAHQYEEMLHDHYINNWSPITGFNYGLNGAVVSVQNGRVFVDWSKFDELVKPYMNGTAYKDRVPAQTLFVPYWIPVKKAKSNEWARRVNQFNYQNIDLELFGQYMKEVERHMTQQGWLDRAMVFYFDEPFISNWKYTAFIETSKVIREHAPSLRIMITDGYKGPEEYKKKSYITDPIEKYVDIWDPVTFQVSSLGIANYYRKRKADGEFDMWNQTLANANPNRAVINLFPEYDMPFHRMWGVMSWNFGFQGIEWWSTIFWWDNNAKQRLDPWTNPVAFPGFRQPLNSDGRLFFPGTYEAIGGPDIPVSSLRMKAVREAIEDYEYLYLLDQLGGIDDFDINILHTTSKENTRAMKLAMPMGKGPWHWWEGDPDAIMKAREDIARLILKMLESNTD